MVRGWTARLGAWDWAFLAVCTLAFVGLAFLGRQTTFWLDDWVILAGPGREGWTADALMRPHNDHWQLTQMLVWKVLQSTVGLRSHLPYLLATLLLHIATALAVYGLARRQAGPFIAFAAGLLFLLLGTGGEVFFFAAAFNLVAATAFGSWALFLYLSAEPLARAGRRRAILVAALLVAAVMSGGPGLFYLPVIAVIALLAPGRRRDLWLVLPAALVFTAWELAYGSGSSIAGHLTDASVLRALGDYVRSGMAHAVGAVTGLDDAIGLVMAVVLLGATAWHLLGRRPLLVGAVAGAVGLLSAYVVTGLARSNLGAEQAAAARYVYTVAPFFLLMASAWLGTLAPIDARRPRVALTVSVFLAVALVANLTQLRWWQQNFVDRAVETRATIALLLRYGGSPALPADRAPIPSTDLQVEHLPSPDGLRELVARYGSPLDDPFSGIASVTPEIEERALLKLVDPAFLVTEAAELPAGTSSPEFLDQADVTLVPDGSCVRVTPAGPGPAVTARVPSGGLVHVRTDAGGTLGVQLSRSGDFAVADVRTIDLPAGGIAAVSSPDLADDTVWRVGLVLPAEGESVICLTAEP